MILTTNNVAHYLIERGLISYESLVSGDVIVSDTTRRNRNFKVTRKHAPSYFVKQIQTWDAPSMSTLRCEAMCYWLAQSDNQFASLAALVPKYYAYDASRHILILELLHQGESMADFHRRSGVFPTQLATKLGQAMGAYHLHIGTTAKGNPQYAIFPKNTPWILSTQLHSLTMSGVSGSSSAANAQLLNIVQKFPDFQRILDELRGEWQLDSLVHGDIKWDNCVVCRDDAADTGNAAIETPLARLDTHDTNGLKLKIIDWEMADFGDALWDVGAIFQANLAFWILSMQVDPARAQSANAFVEMAQYPIKDMQPAMHAFWSAYVATRGIETKKRTDCLFRSIRYGAARMIQTAYEYMHYAPQLTPNALCLLQVSLNILKNPQSAAQDLFGM